MTNIEELERDLQELKTMKDQAQRDNTTRILTREIQQLSRVIQQAKDAKAEQEAR